jgi:hypothetical protein
MFVTIKPIYKTENMDRKGTASPFCADFKACIAKEDEKDCQIKKHLNRFLKPLFSLKT